MEQTYIDIMIQSLEKKEQVLDRIIELDIKQRTSSRIHSSHLTTLTR